MVGKSKNLGPANLSIWQEYFHEETTDDRHNRFPRWRVCGVWEFVRDDGLRTAHKNESPFAFWRSTVEESMRLADLYIPLGAELPAGMRTRDDPDYGPLWNLEDGES